jgi:glycosyltransferase involved in cell wall biosynthesis
VTDVFSPAGLTRQTSADAGSYTRALDCEFTLALNNRTGKYFFCKDLIEASRDLIRACYYWRLPFADLPHRYLARVLGRFARIEVDMRVRSPSSYRFLPPLSRSRPMVFTDPRECVLYRMKPQDVVLCHDMGPLTHPELYSPQVEQLYAAAFARIKAARPLMLFVSDASRREFSRLCGSDYPLMDVVHPPLRSGIASGAERAVQNVPEKFFLTVGAIGARKNQVRSIEAFKASGLADAGYAYVICGGPEPGAENVVSLARDTAGVILTGYVDDEQLRWLYKNAAGFVLPSLLEGFGLPAAEAIDYGLVPLLSGGGALQEVAGDAAIYVDPLDVDAISAGMRSIASLSDEERVARLIRLRQSITRFSLENAIATWRSALLLAARSSAATAR